MNYYGGRKAYNLLYSIPRCLKAFEAGERLKNKWVDSNFPAGTFASEKILNASGNFQIKFIIRRPDDKSVEIDNYSKPI